MPEIYFFEISFLIPVISFVIVSVIVKVILETIFRIGLWFSSDSVLFVFSSISSTNSYHFYVCMRLKK